MKPNALCCACVLLRLCVANLAAWDFSAAGDASIDKNIKDDESGLYASFNGAAVTMSFLWRRDDVLNGFFLLSNGNTVDIFWNSESRIDNLRITPRGFSVDFEYPIVINTNADTKSDYGYITLNLARSENYDAFHYAAGFYYDYFEFLNTGMELSCATAEGIAGFAVKPVFRFRYRDIVLLRCGIDLISMFTGAAEKTIHCDIFLNFKW